MSDEQAVRKAWELNKKREKILIVEDDRSLSRGLEMNLEFEGYEVCLAEDGEAGLAAALDENPDLIVLDLRLPKLSGLEVLECLREQGRETPVIILSAMGREDDKVRGLKLGADDYVSKPFGLKELLARIESALRRIRRIRARDEDVTYRFGDVEVECNSRSVRRGGQTVHLTAKEFDLLAEFLAHPERPYTRETLLRKVWGYDYEGTDRTVDNFVRSLRKKLEARPRKPAHLLTLHGVGYVFKS